MFSSPSEQGIQIFPPFHDPTNNILQKMFDNLCLQKEGVCKYAKSLKAFYAPNYISQFPLEYNMKSIIHPALEQYTQLMKKNNSWDSFIFNIQGDNLCKDEVTCRETVAKALQFLDSDHLTPVDPDISKKCHQEFLVYRNSSKEVINFAITIFGNCFHPSNPRYFYHPASKESTRQLIKPIFEQMVPVSDYERNLTELSVFVLLVPKSVFQKHEIQYGSHPGFQFKSALRKSSSFLPKLNREESK